MSKLYRGIDISLYQGNPDFQKVVDSGIDFIIHKAGQGRMATYNAPFTDPEFEENVKAASMVSASNGGVLYSGSYWYFMANTEAQVREEAAYYINLLKKYQYQLKLWAAVDVEDPSLTYDKATLTKNVKLFCDLIKEAGFKPMVYTSSYWVNRRFDIPAGVPLWEANWSVTTMMDRAQMWQYSSKGSVDGIYGNVDMNYALDIIGDANGDGKVNAADVSLMMKYIAGWDVDLTETDVDINQDGYVNLKDVSLLMKRLAGWDV